LNARRRPGASNFTRDFAGGTREPFVRPTNLPTNARGDRSEVLEGEVRNDNALNGTQVDQFTCQNSGDITAADTQLWRLRNANANGTYQVMQPWSALRAGASRCLDIFNGDDDNGTKDEQWTCNGGGNQEFIGFPGSLS